MLGLIVSLAGCSHRAAAPPEDRTKGGNMWGANFFPNIPLVSHRGEHVGFFDLIKDKVVAVNFIYTKCSDSCPMETARMVEVEQLLGDRMGKDVFFLSISIDPEHDTPARLKEYAQMWHTGPGWTFLTGNEQDVTLLRKKLGVYEADLKKKDHNLGLLIGNQKTGRWMKRSPYENPYILATQLGSWLHNWKLPGAADRDYANAPEVRNISTGEELFRARCASCHTVGGGDTSNLDARRAGPDLLGVTKRRERAWLERWMMHPDQVLAEHDPIATALLAQYKDVVMPNLRLTKSDVDIVLAYIDDAGRAAQPEPESARALESLAAYESMRARLAADDLAGAQALAAPLSAAALSAAAESSASRQFLTDVAFAARSVGGTKDIEAARRAFGELSRQMLALLNDAPQLRKGRFLFLCPMATGYKKWIQTAPTLANPYMGTRMPGCGIPQKDWTPASVPS